MENNLNKKFNISKKNSIYAGLKIIVLGNYIITNNSYDYFNCDFSIFKCRKGYR